MRPTLLYESIPEGTAPLYHYTSQTGVIGMINHKHLWFTHIQYMNDSTEYDYAANLIETVLKDEYNIVIEGGIKYEEIARHYGDVYSFSLSQAEDLLSQWRGYCPNGGYSVSFQQKELSKMMEKQKEDYNIYIGKCIYDEEEQKNVIRNYIVGHSPEEYRTLFIIPLEPLPELPETADPESKDLRGKAESMRRASEDKLRRTVYEDKQYLFWRAIRYAPLFKHKAFQAEQEWRMIAITKNKPELREGKSFMIPYLKIPLVGNDERVQGPKIIVGPTAHTELALRACKLLKTHADVTESKIPFRNW